MSAAEARLAHGAPPRRHALSGRLPILGIAAVSALGLVGCGGSSKSSSSATSHSTPTASTSTTATATATATQQSSAAPTTTATAPSASRTVTATAGAITATIHAGSHVPRVGRVWPLHFAVLSSGRPVKATVSYEYLFDGQVVAHRAHYTFIGHFSDVFRWPSSAVGYPLTFRAAITSQGATINLDYPVKVTR
jgi:hypothetical protein